jgi:phosphatidylserine/phosphatidylglycerophosphate/cardiolipin synthase-like enzyme
VTVFEAAAADALTRLGPGPLRVLADGLSGAWPNEAVAAASPTPGFAAVAHRVLDACDAGGLAGAEAAWYLRGLVAGYEARSAETAVALVWSGPAVHDVPVRATAQVLVEVVSEATQELVLMTYSAKPFPPLVTALRAARGRGVAVDVVVETLQGAGSLLSGDEPAAAFAGVDGVRLWHWPSEQRAEPSSKMHAKLAVADGRLLLASSANLTQSGAASNIEAGLLVRGGEVPRRAAEHVRALQAGGVLRRLV